jgi:hypothetical protein
MRFLAASLFALFVGSEALAQPVVYPDPEFATLVLYRTFSTSNHAPDFQVNQRIWINGEQVCKLSDNRYMPYLLPPGPVLIKARGRDIFSLVSIGRKRKLMLNTKAGKVYYIRCDMPGNRLYGATHLAEVPFDAQQASRTAMQPDRCMEAVHRRNEATTATRLSHQ